MRRVLGCTLALTLAIAPMAFARTQTAQLTRAQAQKIALAKAPGTVESAELEKERGKLVWSFDIRTSKKDITEVLVNAKDGSIVAVEHETPAKEAAEKAKDPKH